MGLVGREGGGVYLSGDHASCGSSRRSGVCVSLAGDHASNRQRVRGVSLAGDHASSRQRERRGVSLAGICVIN